jgi:iron complex transport system ATP-binding protein
MAADDLDIHVEGIGVTVGGRALLHPTTLTLPCGQLIAVVGRNGAGKSTLLAALGGSRRPNHGRIRYGDCDIASQRPADLALLRATLPQDSSFAFGYRVREIVELGRLAHARRPSCCNDARAVDSAIAEFDLTPLAARLVTTLSGGERQRMRMARLVVQMHERLQQLRPAWLLLDEPTAALDVDQQHRLMARLRRYADRGCGVVLVLHDLAIAALYADIVLVLEAGKLVEQGPPADVLAPEAVMRRFGIDVGAVRLNGRGHSLYPHPHPVA